MKLNLGSGGYDLPGYESWDASPDVGADRHLRVPPIPLADARVDAIYMGHLLEHFEPPEAAELLAECKRVLVPGGTLGVVVPHTRKVLERYLTGDHTEVEVPQGRFWNLDDLEAVCSVFLFSTIQPSRHKWAYDAQSLCTTLERAGFVVDARIRPDDPRLSVPRWYDLGYQCHTPEARP